MYDEDGVRKPVWNKYGQRNVAVTQKNQIQDQHVEDSLTFGKKDSHTRMCYENNLKRGTTRGIPLHHPYDYTVWPKTFPVKTNYEYLNYGE